MAEITAAEIKRLRALEEENERLKNQIAGVFEGFAMCVNNQCERFDSQEPIALMKDWVEVRDPTTHVVTSANDYLRPVDDADLPCPSCGSSRTMTTQKLREYARIAPS